MAKASENLIPQAHVLTVEEQSKGGKASGKARREKTTMRQMLEMCLDMTNEKGQTYRELITVGLLKGAMSGNPTNYRTAVEMLGELSAETTNSTPTLKVEIVDNSNLEKTLYETNKSDSDVKGQ